MLLSAINFRAHQKYPALRVDLGVMIPQWQSAEVACITYLKLLDRTRNNGRSTDNVRTDCGFDRSNFGLAGHVDRSKFNRIENEINLRFLLFSCYLTSRCVLRNFDMKSWWHATRAVVYNSRIETDIAIRPLPVTKLPNISTFIGNFQIFILGLWTPKRVIHHIHLTGQKRYVTEQKWIWPVIVTGDYPKIISSPASPSSFLPYLSLKIFTLFFVGKLIYDRFLKIKKDYSQAPMINLSEAITSR